MQTKDKRALMRATRVLRAVLLKLQTGIRETDLYNEFKGKQVSPGVSVRNFVHQLRLGRSLVGRNGSIKMRKHFKRTVTI